MPCSMEAMWRETEAPNQQPTSIVRHICEAILDPQAELPAKYSHMSDFKQYHMEQKNCLVSPGNLPRESWKTKITVLSH